MAMPSDTLLPTSTAKDGLFTSIRPYLVTMWPVARISKAPSGSAMAQSGHERLKPFGFQATTIAPATTAAVPIAIGVDSRSPRKSMANIAPKIGVTAGSEAVSVGPIILMLEMASEDEIPGRMIPTMANSSAAMVSQY